jgi:hypothetical protein
MTVIVSQPHKILPETITWEIWHNKTKVAEFGPKGLAAKEHIVKKTADYTAQEWDRVVLVDTSAGAVTITLPAAPADGQVHTVKKCTSNANTLTVSGNGKLIDGFSSIGTGATIDLVTLTLHYFDGAWHDR